MRIQLRPLPDFASLEKTRRVTVADILKLEAFTGASVLAGRAGLNRLVTHVNVMQVPTGRFAVAGDLVLAADDAFDRSSRHPADLLGALEARKVAAVAIRGGGLESSGKPLARVADDRQLPLVELPDNAHLSELHGAVLEALVANQATELRHAAAVREQMAAFALGGGELDDLPDATADLADGDVAIVADREVLASSAGWGDADVAVEMAEAWHHRGEQGPALADGGFVVWPLVAGPIQVGCLVARLSGPLEAVRLAALEYGGNIAALNILHRQEAQRAETQLHNQFVRDLLSGIGDAEAASRRAAALGWHEHDRFLVLLARSRQAPAEKLHDVVHGISPAAATLEYMRTCLAIIATSEDPAQRAEPVIAALLDVHPDVHVGTSAVVDDLAGLPRGLAQAEEALTTADLFDAHGHARHHSELGSLRMLAVVARGELESFVNDTLAPLEGIEPGGDGPLTATLTLLLQTGLNLSETARRGSWHYNTVRYRVDRLTELLGPFREDGSKLQALSIALQLRDELGTTSAATDIGLDAVA